MAITLLVVTVVLAGANALPDLARWRDFSWLRGALQNLTDGRTHSAWVFGLPIVLVLVCAAIQFALSEVLFGLPGFAFAVAVLFLCWGPRDLDADIDAVVKAPDRDRRLAAAQALRPDPADHALPFESAPLVEASFASALSRWFGVLFWFVLLGPAGALGYRCVQLLARSRLFAADIDSERRAELDRAARVLDWAPAHLIALALALVSDFDAVLGTWRDYHRAHGKGYFTLDLGFLGALAHAGVDADVVAGDGYSQDASDPLLELLDARRALQRVLITWLAVIALLVLAGWVR